MQAEPALILETKASQNGLTQKPYSENHGVKWTIPNTSE
jgi:hypothetical protein